MAPPPRKTLMDHITSHGKFNDDAWRADLPPAETYPADTVLVRQGNAPGRVYFIEHGITKLVATSRGHEQIVGLRGPGWFLGAALAVTRQPCPVSVVTVDPCALRPLSETSFRSWITADTGLSWYVHRMHSLEVLKQFRHLTEIGLPSARRRLEHILWHLAAVAVQARPGRTVELTLPLKRADMAALLAIRPEHLSRLIKQLRNDGVIDVRRGWIVVPDTLRLASETDAFGGLTNPLAMS